MELKRDISPELYAAYQQRVIYPTMLVDIDWPTGPVRAHTGTGLIEYDGKQWAGVGALADISLPGEVGGAASQGASIEFAAALVDLLEYADEADARGKDVDIYTGITTTPGGTEIVGVMRALTGSVSKTDFTLNEDKLTAQATVSIKSGQPARAAAQITHTNEDQQALHPGDTIFRRVEHAEKWRTNPPQWPA
ncbi:MAG: hypothetical protein WA790_15855 [Sulfitobacter sp.]